MQDISRIRIVIRGAVQGVGFRPFVYRLATSLGLYGWVSNSTDGLFIEADGLKETLDDFLVRIGHECPKHAAIQSLEYSFLDPAGFGKFEIRPSDSSGCRTALILPDISVCAVCVSEIFDSSNRRYLYPFTNCTNCGPRFTIVDGLPYDRASTTMRGFTMCCACRSEYENPLDRRFHAQPNACPDCGPHVELWDRDGAILADRHEAIRQAANLVQSGCIIAVKGLGGFHLMTDAMNEEAVVRLRQRKHREEKPFALMAPSLEAICGMCAVSSLERRALLAPEAPIVLLSRHGRPPVAPSVAPRNPYVGVMLPYTPLHHILMSEINMPVVATSGNRTDEPIAIDERLALRQLGAIADAFLVHDRPIRRHADDSIVRILLGREQVLRRGRGYAPLPVTVNRSLPVTLAVGGHLKNSVALAVGANIFISQHIGDLETKEAFCAFRRVIDDFRDLYETPLERIACDAHPDYASTTYAAGLGETHRAAPMQVQHHWAHVLSCMAENGIDTSALGVAWDGAGYGSDGTIWGGEFLLAGSEGFERVAHLRTFPLPGGNAAVKKPKQAALGLLYEILGERAFDGTEPLLLRQMIEKGIRTPRTSSAGRLFDAVASITGIRNRVSFEGQAAMELEFAVRPNVEEPYPYLIQAGEPLIADWEPMIHSVLRETRERVEAGVIAARFHNTLVEIIADVARRVGEPRVVLTGGCFQNRYLTERTVRRLTGLGFRVYWHQRVPPNDGGLALGQAVAVGRR